MKNKRYKCKYCDQYYHAPSSKGNCGSVDCLLSAAMKHVKSERRRKARDDRRAWTEKKKKWNEELGIEPIGNKDPLQRAINTIVRILDKDLPCYMLPDYKTNGQAKQAGHIISRKECPEIKYLLLNIHGESVFSNSNPTISDTDRMKAICGRYSPKVEEGVSKVIEMNKGLKLSKKERDAKIIIANEIIKHLTDGLVLSRRDIDERLGIYKLPPLQFYNI